MKRILIIRLDGLGDTLLTLPLLDRLKACWPDCDITYLASPRGAPVFAADARVDHLWTVEVAAMSKKDKMALGLRIRETEFDVVFCLNEKFWPALWTRMSYAPICVGFDPGWPQPPKTLLRRLTLTHRLPHPNDPSLPSIHEVERYAALATLAGCPDAMGSSRIVLPAEARDWADSAITAMKPADGQVLVCLHLSAKWASEGWDGRTCLNVARSLLDHFPELFLVVTAGPGEERFFENAAAVLPAARFQLFTALDLLQWAALMEKCRVLVSMDTGAVHLAAAVNVPVVAVFPEQYFIHASSRWSPWQVPHRVIRRPSPASPDHFWAELCSAVEDLL